jgi:hypothetical protein
MNEQRIVRPASAGGVESTSDSSPFAVVDSGLKTLSDWFQVKPNG